MSQKDLVEESGQTVRGPAPVSAVPIPNHVVYNDGRGLVHSLDYVVLLHLLFATAAGRSLTPPQLWEELKAQGIRSAKNANELVGKNAVYESFARLIAAGYVRRFEQANEQFPGRKGRIAYEVYDNPAWNPDWKPQATLPGTPEALPKGAGQNASRNAGTANDTSGVPGSVKRRVPAGQNASAVPERVEASPPHPPEGGGTTSPSPQKTGRATKADRWAAACALDAEDYQPTAEEVAAADAFLQDLPGKWQMGVDEARSLAPLLASRVHTQGHELDTYLELALIQDDPKDPARVPARVMPVRIRGLKRKRTEERPLPPQQAAGNLAPWCGECNGGEEPREVFQRFRELPDGSDVPCQACHPKHARANA
ncbi:hypothetical protein [Streptomyces decoyicus]